LLADPRVAPAAEAPSPESTERLPPKTYEVVALAEGVHGFLWTDPLQDPIEGNALFIVNDRDVVVVDTALFPSSAAIMAAELRKLTDKPVRYVVNTHWHDDHHGGNQVYRELWPGAEFVAHRLTRQDAITLTHEARPGVLAGYAEQIATVRRWAEQGHDDAGKPVDEARKGRIDRYVALLQTVIDGLDEVVATLPDLVFDDALILRRGERTIEIRFLGLGNTRGDVVVFLPNERIVATGDLMVYPAPANGRRRSRRSALSKPRCSFPATAQSCTTGATFTKCGICSATSSLRSTPRWPRGSPSNRPRSG
jgi:glyoxylase-like metal-dependent hydrolase (beta-lactamase superfamily II)